MNETSPTENLKARTERRQKVLKATIFGGLYFAALSLAVMLGSLINFWRTGDFLFQAMIVGVPTNIFLHVLAADKIEWWIFYERADWLALFLCSIANSLLGAFLFAVPVAFWQFIVKDDRKD